MRSYRLTDPHIRADLSAGRGERNHMDRKRQIRYRDIIAAKRGIGAKIDTPEHPGFFLVLVTKKWALYFNPGDEFLIVDLGSKEILDEEAADEKYQKILKEFIGQDVSYEFIDMAFLRTFEIAARNF